MLRGSSEQTTNSWTQPDFWRSFSRRIVALIVSAAINGSLIPAIASECASSKDIDASRSRWATLRSQPASTTDNEKTCRAYVGSFYESVTLRQAAARCADRERNLAVLDSEINAFNELLATKCSRRFSKLRGNDNPQGARRFSYLSGFLDTVSDLTVPSITVAVSL
jgi:hypothetical protein